jgi:hypothetical protein
LEDEIFPIEEHEDWRREENISRRGGWIRPAVNAADLSPAPESEQRVEEIQGEDRRLAGASEQRFHPGKGDKHVARRRERPVLDGEEPDEIPMFAWFVERGLALPASHFFKGLLKYYGIEYLNLNPNRIFHVFVFVHFCEAFVGIKPHWVLFRKFFRLKLQSSANDPRVVGGAGIQMREDAAE